LEHPLLIHLFVCDIVAQTENNSLLLVFLAYVLFLFTHFCQFPSYNLVYLLLCFLCNFGVLVYVFIRSNEHIHMFSLSSIFCKFVIRFHYNRHNECYKNRIKENIWNTLEKYHIYKISKDRLQMSDTYISSYNPIFETPDQIAHTPQSPI
jgi:hypothetical protein